MKKLLLSGFASVSLMLTGASALFANGTPVPETVAEGVEISGNVDVVAGYQHDDQDAVGNNLGGMGDVTFATGANADHFRFIVDQVEIDLAKSFGENIRLRADVDFTDFANAGHRVANAFDLEQAYVTANLAAGNGIEFLIGKFNAPVGIESVDRNENWLSSYSPNFRWLAPVNNLIGAKLYYAFSDLIDWHVAVVNDLNGNGFGDSAIPSALSRVGFNWGEEGNESTVGISGGGGPEWDTATGNTSNNAHWDFYGDLDALVALTDTVNLGAEGTYRQSNSLSGAGANQKAIAGQLLLNYEASDVWDVTFRYGYEWDINPANARGGSGASTTSVNWNGGFEGTLHSGTVGAGYQIADGAKMKMEYRFDFAAVSGAAANSDYHSLLAEFAYTF